MQQRSIEDYINEMMRMRERAVLPPQPEQAFRPQQGFPPVIRLGHENPPDLENGTEKEDFSVRSRNREQQTMPSIMLVGHENPPDLENGTEKEDFSVRSGNREQQTMPPIMLVGHENPPELESNTEPDDFSGRRQNDDTEEALAEAEEAVQTVSQDIIPVGPPADMEEPPREEQPAPQPSQDVTPDPAREQYDSPQEIAKRIADDESFEPKTPLVRGEGGLLGNGKLIVNVTTGAGLFPVVGATVIISDMASAGGAEIAALTTDISGKTPPVYLPAPSQDISLKPSENGDNTDPRARYAITVMAPGYVTTIVEGASVFDGVTSIQKVDMLTLSAADGNTAPRIITEDTVYRL